jgi:hypothetical protein
VRSRQSGGDVFSEIEKRGRAERVREVREYGGVGVTREVWRSGGEGEKELPPTTSRIHSTRGDNGRSSILSMTCGPNMS